MRTQRLHFLVFAVVVSRISAQFLGTEDWREVVNKVAYLHEHGVEQIGGSLSRVISEHPFLQSDVLTTAIFGGPSETGGTPSAPQAAALLCKEVNHLKALKLSQGCVQGMQDYFCSLARWMGTVAANCSMLADETQCRACEQQKKSKLSLAGLWPWKVLDAIGKPPPGISELDINWLGDFEMCKSLDIPIEGTENKRRFVGRYCSATLGLPAAKFGNSIPVPCQIPTRQSAAAQNSSKQQCDTSKTPINLRIGFCLPKQCGTDDATIMTKTIFRSTCSASATCEAIDGWSVSGLALSGFVGFMAVILIIGGLYDVLFYQVGLRKIEKHSANMSSNARSSHHPADAADISKSTDLKQTIQYTKKQYYNDLPILAKILLCFSVTANGRKMFGTKQSSDMIACVNGIRFLSLLWVMLGHSYLFGLKYVRNNVVLLEFPRELLFQVVNNGTVSVDTFFTMSGFLLTYLFLKKTKQTHGRQLKSPRFWIMYYVHRYIRLTPMYAAVILIGSTVYPNIGNGPFWLGWDIEIVKHCSSRWWQNLLYINNLVGEFNEQCIGWSWYLANDMQFYIVAPVLLVLFWVFPAVALGLSSAVVLVSAIIRAYIVRINDYPPTVIFSAKDPHAYWKKTTPFSTEVYSKPWTRIGPFVIGMVLGYVLFKTKGKLRMNKFLALVIWIITFLLTVGVVCGLLDYSKTGEMNPTLIMLYAAVNRSVWAFAVSITIYMCAQGYGGVINRFLSWRLLVPLSRITYAAYLLHEFVIFFYYTTLRKTLYGSHTSVWVYFIGSFTVTYSLAVVTSLMFEAPVIQLEKLIFHPPAPKQSSSSDLPPKSGGPLSFLSGKSPKAPTPDTVAADYDMIQTVVRNTEYPNTEPGIPPGTRL